MFTTAGVKCCVAAVKSHPNFISVLLYLFWSFGINYSDTLVLRIEYRSNRCSERCCTFHYLSCTDSIVCNIHLFILVWLFSRDQLLTRIFLHCINTVKIIWRLSSFTGGGRPQVPLEALFQAPEKLTGQFIKVSFQLLHLTSPIYFTSSIIHCVSK